MVNVKDEILSDRLHNINDTLAAMTTLGNEFHMESEQRRAIRDGLWKSLEDQVKALTPKEA